MPITVNDGSVLRMLSSVTTNDGGVLHELNTVHTNDGGVLREIFHANKGATVSGITPLVAAEDHIVIVDSGSFTLSAPAGAKIIVGGAAKETSGGNVAEYTLESAVRNAQCTVQCGAVNSGNATTLTIDGTAYGSGSVKQIIQSKWGPIGGDGGYFAHGIPNRVTDGTGAGGGGGFQRYDGTDYANGKGGNKGGYGNFGGDGGNAYAGVVGEDGASGKGGSNPPAYCTGGGGGGFSAGGGDGGGASLEAAHKAPDGEGGAGIVVIEW